MLLGFFHPVLPSRLISINKTLPGDVRTLLSASRAGIKVPTVEVRWQNLHVECNVVVGDRGLPTVMNSYRTFIEVCYAVHELPKRTSLYMVCLSSLAMIMYNSGSL